MKCPVCAWDGQYDGTDCTACGFNAEQYTPEEFKGFLKRGFVNPIGKEKVKRKRKAKMPPQQDLKSGIKVYKKGCRPLSEDELTVMKNKRDEDKMGFAASRMGRDTVRAINKRIADEGWSFEQVRTRFIGQLIQELKEVIS